MEVLDIDAAVGTEVTQREKTERIRTHPEPEVHFLRGWYVSFGIKGIV